MESVTTRLARLNEVGALLEQSNKLLESVGFDWTVTDGITQIIEAVDFEIGELMDGGCGTEEHY